MVEEILSYEKLITIVLCTSMILEGCSFMDKRSNKRYSQKVSVKIMTASTLVSIKNATRNLKKNIKMKPRNNIKICKRHIWVRL